LLDVGRLDSLEALGAIVERLAQRVDAVAWSIELDDSSIDLPKTLAASGRHRTPTRALCIPLRAANETIGRWCVDLPRGRVLRGCDVAFLESCAAAIAAPLRFALASTVAADRAGDPPTEPLGDRSPDERRPYDDTVPLRRAVDTAAEAWHDDFVAASPAMQAVLELVRRLSDSELPVLISGESGTGKDHVARLLHRAGSRSTYPLITQNCSSIPADLLEADLFGFKRGAFSGAEQTRTGFIFQAQQGTFHLEGIGDVDATIQRRLLHLIESRSVRPLGGTGHLDLNVRFVASTHRDLAAMVESGEFRKDLYYRLCGGTIHLPPLRERPDDLDELVRVLGDRQPEGPPRLSEAALVVLRAHRWPGNVRELAGILRRLAVEHAGEEVTEAAVETALGPRREPSLFPASIFAARDFDALRRELDEAHLRWLWERHDGDLDAIARELDTSTRGVYRRFERLGLKPTALRRDRNG